MVVAGRQHMDTVRFLLLAVIVVASAGSGKNLAVFTPAPSPEGISGVGLGMVFGILSFVGFDAAATLGRRVGTPGAPCPRPSEVRWSSSSALSTCS